MLGEPVTSGARNHDGCRVTRPRLRQAAGGVTVTVMAGKFLKQRPLSSEPPESRVRLGGFN